MSKTADQTVLNNIIAILGDKKITQVDFIKSLNTRLPEKKQIKTRTTFSDWKKGKSSSYTKIIPEIAEVLNVSVGDLYVKEPSSDSPKKPARYRIRITTRRSPAENDIVRLYRSASPEAKALVRDFLVKDAALAVVKETTPEKFTAVRRGPGITVRPTEGIMHEVKIVEAVEIPTKKG